MSMSKERSRLWSRNYSPIGCIHYEGLVLRKDMNCNRLMEMQQHKGKIILTNGFVKKTQKTPTEEIKLAKKYRADFKERIGKS